MIVIAVVAAVFLAASAGMALVRIVRGPSTLDRIVGTDVLLAITVCAIATEAAYSRDATGLPILLGLSLLGAAGSVAVARFADPAARRTGVTTPLAAASPTFPTPVSPPDREHAGAAQAIDRPMPASSSSLDLAPPADQRADPVSERLSVPDPVAVSSGLADAATPDPDETAAPQPGKTPVSGGMPGTGARSGTDATTSAATLPATDAEQATATPLDAETIQVGGSGNTATGVVDEGSGSGGRGTETGTGGRA